MAGISIDSALLADKAIQIGTIISDNRPGVIYQALLEDRPVRSTGATIDAANPISDEECRQVTTGLNDLFAMTQQGLQSVHDSFVGTDSDMAAKVSV